ncbi:MAG: fasciclin domain-containing protein [Methanosarcinales archaeon]|nr:fasciclin domain-containing protein [Methanosarcinales archaeon]
MAGYTEESADESEAAEPEMVNIVETAMADENLSTLVTAIETAELADALSAEGPFTVFAPTNEAFDMLPEGELESLMNDTEALGTVLKFHVAEGAVMSADLSDGMTIPTLQGDNLTISITEEGVMVNEAMVTEADIECSNGVIHVIDAVLMP